MKNKNSPIIQLAKNLSLFILSWYQPKSFYPTGES